MVKLFPRSRAVRTGLFVLLLTQIVGCVSKEDRARSYYVRGMKFVSEHNNAKAAIELRNAVSLKRDFIDAWKALAEVDEIGKDWPRVVSDLQTIVRLAPDEVSARLKLGKVLLLTGTTNEALALANAGLDRDEGNADLHALKADIALKLGDQAGAVREAQIARTLDPTNAAALMVLAVNRQANGDPNGALSILKSPDGSKKLEDNVQLQLLKIKLFGQIGDLKSIEAGLKELIEQHSNEIGYRKLLVNFYVDQHRTDDAERELRSLVAANPSDSAAELDLVRFLFSVKRAQADARQELKSRIDAGGDVFPFQMALANMDFAEGNTTASEQLLNELTDNAGAPERVQLARIALARMYLSLRRFDQAQKLADDVIKVNSQSVPALTLRATVHLERSQDDAAIADLTKALSYRPRSFDLMLLLATSYERSGLIELADQQFADATRASGFNPHIVVEYAGFLERRGSLARAEDVLMELTKQQPKNVELLSALARVRLARQNWSGAKEVAQSLRQIADNGLADEILGAALMGSGSYEDATVPLRKAYEAGPDVAPRMASLVSAYLKANRKDRALDFLKSILAKNPGNANALVALGSIELSDGENDQAIASFMAATKAQPKDPAGYQALADFYLRQKNYDEAIRIVRAGIQQQPDIMALQIVLAGAFEKKGDYEAAISQYETMLSKEPGNLIVANNLASLLLDHRADQQSLGRAQSIVAILRKSQMPQFKDTLGWAKYREGNYDTAVSLCEEAAAALPDQAAVHYHLGMGYAAVGRNDKASKQLKKALELAPDDGLAKEITSALDKLGRQAPQPDKPS